MTTNIKVALTNLCKYNEGELIYTWLDLPASQDEIDEAMDEIGIGASDKYGAIYEEWFISDYEAPFSIGEYASLRVLNETAELLGGLGGDEMNAVIAIKDNDDSLTWDEAAEMLHDGDANLIHDCNDMEDVARYYIEESGAYDTEQLGSLANYIDYKAFGRDMSFEGTYLFIDNSICVEVRY